MFIHKCLCGHMFVSFGNIPRERIGGSHSYSTLSTRNCKLVFKGAELLYIFTGVKQGLSPLGSPQHSFFTIATSVVTGWALMCLSLKATEITNLFSCALQQRTGICLLAVSFIYVFTGYLTGCLFICLTGYLL